MIKKLSVLFIVISLLTACDSIDDLEVIGSPQIRLTGFGDDGIQLALVLKIRNPNKYSFKVKKGRFNVQINGNEIGDARLTGKVKISANSTEVYTFPINASLQGKDLSLDLILSVIMNGQFNLKLNGEIKAGNYLFVYDTFDVEWEERVGF